MRVELPDAFEAVEVTVPTALQDWFEREALSRNMTLEELFACKAAGLTVHQLEAARKHGVDVEAYVLRWIVNQAHQIGTLKTDMPSAPSEAHVAKLADAATKDQGK